MPERRDRSADVFTRDGLLRRARLVGHSDAAGRIRERDGTFFRGEEIGLVDDRGRIRRKGGIVGRGEAVGRIKGNAVYTTASLLGKARQLGRVDAQGRIWQQDCGLFEGRQIGHASGADPEMGLAFFVLKFQGIADHVVTLEEKIAESEDRAAFLPRVRSTRNVLPQVDALGDFDALGRRLAALEKLCLRDLAASRRGSEAPVTPETQTAPATGDRLLRVLGASRYRRAEVALERIRERVGEAAEDTLRRLNVDDPTIAEAELVEELCPDDLYGDDPSFGPGRRPGARVLDAVQRLSGVKGSEPPRVARPTPLPRTPLEVQDAILVREDAPDDALGDPTELAQIRAYVDEVIGAERADQLKTAVVAGLQEVLGIAPEEQAERLRRAAERLASLSQVSAEEQAERFRRAAERLAARRHIHPEEQAERLIRMAERLAARGNVGKS